RSCVPGACSGASATCGGSPPIDDEAPDADGAASRSSVAGPSPTGASTAASPVPAAGVAIATSRPRSPATAPTPATAAPPIATATIPFTHHLAPDATTFAVAVGMEGAAGTGAAIATLRATRF